MLVIEFINLVVVALTTVIILVCTIGIIIASKFQNKQKQKYNDCLRIIKEKENSTFQIKSSLSREEINGIDPSIDVDILMSDLYNKYLKLENNLKILDDDFDELLIGNIKDIYIGKVNIFKNKNYVEVNDGIDLINYSITEFKENKLKFRVTVNCFNYKKSNEEIVSGSNLEKVEQVIILTFEKGNNEWLISGYEKVYEKQLQS